MNDENKIIRLKKIIKNNKKDWRKIMINEKNIFNKGLIFMLIFCIPSLKSINDDKKFFTAVELNKYLLDQNAEFKKSKLKLEQVGLVNFANSVEELIALNNKMMINDTKNSKLTMETYNHLNNF